MQLTTASIHSISYQKEKEWLRPQAYHFWVFKFVVKADQKEDRDHNEFSITWPRISIKNGIFKRIWILFYVVIPSMDSVNQISLFIF